LIGSQLQLLSPTPIECGRHPYWDSKINAYKSSAYFVARLVDALAEPRPGGRWDQPGPGHGEILDVTWLQLDAAKERVAFVEMKQVLVKAATVIQESMGVEVS